MLPDADATPPESVSGPAATPPESVSGALDPVTFEVIRHRLWAINDDQGRMAARLSGSFIVYENYDFNAALITADGRGLYCGMYILQHGATIDEFVRRVLSSWPADDIREGDMFFTNDPWWGALHANDGILAMPIMRDGRIVAWSGIVMHDDDVGSPIPGSFVSGAHDRFGEAPLFPGVKLVEGFQPRRDIERAYLRNSRVPEHNALNMRARVAALRTTYRRISELIDEYGVETFLDAQEGILGYVERVLRSRLQQIPDGEWYAKGYHDHDGNVNNVYPICCRLIKRGDHLTVDFRGTAEQALGSINCARPAMEGSVVGVLLTFLCYDLPWAVGAVRNVVAIVSDEGTLNNAVSPAAMSLASTMMTLSTQDVVAHAFAKMLLASEKFRDESQASWSPGINGDLVIAANPGGEPHVGMVVDAVSGGGGARVFGDGIDSGGIFHSMATQGANVETVESRVPVLQLYRREKRDAGGAGRYRGGVPVEFATVPHKLAVGPAGLNTICSGAALPAGRGLAGGAPGGATSNVVLRGSNVRELMASGEMPMSAGAVDCQERVTLAAKGYTTLDETDVVVGVLAGGGGYGDPLRRDPSAVAADVRDGLVSEAAALSIYGVVMSGDAVDEAATQVARERERRQRLATSEPPAQAGAPAHGDTVVHCVSDTVEAVSDNGQVWLRCTECGFRFGHYGEDYKAAALMRERPLDSLSSANALCLDAYVAREFHCPGCGTRIAVDVQARDEPALPDVIFAPPQARA